MIIADLDGFLQSLSQLLAAHQGKRPAADFEQFRSALLPFRELTLIQFSQVLDQKAASVSVAAPKRTAKASKPALKSDTDTDAIQDAVHRMGQLFDACIQPSCAYSEIEAAVRTLADQFDVKGLKAVAQEFGIRSGLRSKEDARKRIEEKIKERKAQADRAARVQHGGSVTESSKLDSHGSPE